MLHEISFKSYNGRDTVYGWVYVPVCAPKGIVQLIHGFNEHSRRYLPMIVRFLEAGYIVAADDHVGHGKTALENRLPGVQDGSGTWGNWGDAGFRTMMEDEYTLTGIVKGMYPALPYFLFGHSMGSMIARDYATKYGSHLAGMTICGTAGVYPVPEDVVSELDAAIAAGQGEAANPELFGRVMGWRNERCGPVVLGNEWICTDPDVRRDHAADPFNTPGRLVTMQSLRYYLEMFRAVVGPEWAVQVPGSVPVYNIAGSEDPVGTYGEGVRQVHQWLEETGHTVTTRIYEGARHEIHSEPAIRKELVEDIVRFMDGVLAI